jgi:hypothetical protein
MASPLTGVRQPCTRPQHGERAAGLDAQNGERAVVETGTIRVDEYRVCPPTEDRCRRWFLSRSRRETRPCCLHMLREHVKATDGTAEAAVSFWAGCERNGWVQLLPGLLFNMKETCDHSFSYKTGRYLYLSLHGRTSRTRTPRFTEYGLPHAWPQNRPVVTTGMPCFSNLL